MASEFKDWDEFAAEPITLPFRGKEYVLPEVTIEQGVRLTQELGKDDSPLAQLTAEESWKFVLGDDLYARMVADRLPAKFVTTAVLVALADFQYGREAAVGAWQSRLDPQKVAAAEPEPQSPTTPDAAA